MSTKNIALTKNGGMPKPSALKHPPKTHLKALLFFENDLPARHWIIHNDLARKGKLDPSRQRIFDTVDRAQKRCLYLAFFNSRHNGNINVLYVDGHANAISFSGMEKPTGNKTTEPEFYYALPINQ